MHHGTHQIEHSILILTLDGSRPIGAHDPPNPNGDDGPALGKLGGPAAAVNPQSRSQRWFCIHTGSGTSNVAAIQQINMEYNQKAKLLPGDASRSEVLVPLYGRASQEYVECHFPTLGKGF